LSRLDDVVGAWIERRVIAHHRRRLRRLGWAHALDAPPGSWSASGSFPPARGNDVELLIDGEEALARCADDLERARRRVLLAGWHFDPRFRLRREGPTLRELLAELSQRVDVRMLAWAGAPLPLFHPDRREVRAARNELVAGTRIRFVLDSRERPLHCHHEKLVVVDDEVAYVGGIDLTAYAGDRVDSSAHPQRAGIGWHDGAARVRGPAVADVARHFLFRWRELTAEDDAPGEPPPAGGLDVQLVRTVPERVYRALPRGEFSVLEAYLAALRSAERLIYLENQFLWSPEVVFVLADKLRRPPSDEFRLVALLPARANDGQEDTRGQLAVLEEADGGAGRFIACCLYQRGGSDARPVYVHAKIGIVDDRWLTIGSANLNEHSLFNDTEVNLVLPDPGLARATRARLWSEHLGRDVAPDADPRALLDDVWKPVAHEQLARRRAGDAQTHHLVRLPPQSRRARALLGPLNGLFVDG